MKSKLVFSSCMLLSTMLVTPVAFGYEKSDARHDCKRKINSQWGYENAHGLSVTDLGHKNYTVSGKVKAKKDSKDHSFSCNVRHGELSSWHINPAGVGEDHKLSNKEAAIGAGILAVAAIVAIANKDKNDDKKPEGSVFDDIDYLKKQCKKEIRSHLRHDHGKISSLELRNVHLNHRKLSGNGRVSFRDGEHHRLSFGCDFDRSGRVHDGDYHYSGSDVTDYSLVPEIVARPSGEIEVRMPGGCTALYNSKGDLITRGSSCSSKERHKADDAAKRYLREQGV